MKEKTASIPSNLFIETPEMQDVSLHQLGTDTDSWPEEVIQKLKERIPDVNGMNLMVKFMKKDEENGAATGSVLINSPDESAVIPVIIKDFMLFPLDIMIAQKKLLPLTPDYFKGVFSENEVFGNIEEFPTFGGLGRFEDANLWNAIYPPSLGRYAYASAGYPVMDLISDTVDGSKLKEKLAEDKAVATQFWKNGHAELIRKVANLQPVNMNEFRQGADNLIPRGIAMMRFDGPNKYTLLQNATGVFSPALTRLNREEAKMFVSKISDDVDTAINEVDRNGEKILKIPKGDEDSVHLAKEDSEEIEVANEFDHYQVRNKNGVTYTGIVIPKVIDFDQKPVDLKMFVSPGMSTVQKEISGVRVENCDYEIEGCAPRIGQTGTFVYHPDKSHALATVPVTIKSMVQDQCERLILTVCDMMGAELKIKFAPSVHLQRIHRHGDRVTLPTCMKWQPMEGFHEVTEKPEDWTIKTAAQKLTDAPVTIIPTGFDQYALRGVKKYASECGWDPTNLEKYQASFLLASMGLGEEKIGSLLKHAHRSGQAEVHGLKRPPLQQEKVAKAKPLAERLTKIAADLRCDLVKEASYFENSQTVDSLLSLNFVSPDNISKFVAKIPHFKSTISHLASCILASRLGLQEIPEQASSTAMSRLIDVVEGLEKLKASQEMGLGG